MTTYIPNCTIYIHLHNRRGMFRVSKYNADYIWVQVKHKPDGDFYQSPNWDDQVKGWCTKDQVTKIIKNIQNKK